MDHFELKEVLVVRGKIVRPLVAPPYSRPSVLLVNIYRKGRRPYASRMHHYTPLELLTRNHRNLENSTTHSCPRSLDHQTGVELRGGTHSSQVVFDVAEKGLAEPKTAI